jgi:drug/metabolite transporter (DMT)-like permease
MAIGAVLGWAIGIVIGRGVYETTPPIGLTFWRWLVAGLCLIPWVIPRLKKEGPIIIKFWKSLLAMGILMVGASTLSMLSVNYTTAINVSLVNAGQPITTAIIAWVIFKEKLTNIQIMGVAIGAFGIIAMVSRTDLLILRSLNFNSGDLLMLIAIIGYGSYSNTLRTIGSELGLTTMIFSVIISGCIALSPLYLYETATYLPMPTDWMTVVSTCILAIITSLIPTYLWSAAISTIGVNRSAIFVNLIPVFGAALATIFLNEQIYLYHTIGASLICIGILFVIRDHNSKTS